MDTEFLKSEVKFTERRRWLFLGLPFSFTKYELSDTILTIKQGFLTTSENDCYMYKIQDVKLTRTLMERIFGLSTVTCFTGDTTHPEVKLVHIKNGREIKDYIMKVSEEMRLKRRTVSMMDISAETGTEIFEET